jgi:pyridoxine kinase
MKKIVTIQDISCVGKCSLTVALPIISSAGIETAIIPTTILSTHTGFKNFTFRDLSSDIPLISNHWQKENFKFNAIYTGYLGNVEQIEMVKDFINKFNTKDNFILIDPAMADNGKLYTGFDKNFVKKMKELCDMGDIIVPNLTEASLLLGIEYKDNFTVNEIKDMLLTLSKTVDKVVITDINIGNKIGIMSYDGKEYYSYFRTKIPAKYHGSGDVFASSLLGCLCNNIDLNKSLKIAVDYTWICIKETYKNNKNAYGLNFETKIKYYIDRIQNS